MYKRLAVKKSVYISSSAAVVVAAY